MAGRGVTIRDVAAHAGVSLGTASRVLSGHPATSADARARVTQAVTELGYRPNAQARSLRLTRTHAIGLLVSDVRNPFFADVAHAAEQAALGADYVTLLGNANENVEQQDRYIETFLMQRVDGVVLAPQGRGSGSLEALIESRMPVVFVDRTVEGFDVPSVTTDSRPGIEEAIASLTAAGHSRIGYIAGPQAISTGRQRYDAFIDALPRHGIDVDPSLITFGDFQEQSGVRAAQQLLAAPDRPTAILAADNLMALGALAATRQRGLHIGSDIEVVAFDDIEWLAHFDPPISVIAQDAGAVGRCAVELLLSVVEGEEPESVVLPTTFIDRSTRTKS
ncbi:LacI family transcriptional regulator [Mycolicibacterium agri]|uniref:LacI family transcriptional regulator n=1 Tax=Mycolicibacterium agri TaxID=36811 RepID=A0A2A7N6C6_MYCAG|nr:LacI family DNA-binding transcriptional regulator [Mycolicibacterium agri]PEG38978.1 LacI family transcriptional regulator [Mycolicibacterium agri]GFG53208.1 LacI family transcriptional regulator [Mycolicibacterium agri]